MHNYVVTKKYTLDRLHWTGMRKFQEFGPLVREEIVPGVNLVLAFDPNDIRTMYMNEGKCPSRRSHLALQKLRTDRPDLYNDGGLLPTNGPEWARIRQEAQKSLSLKAVQTLLPQVINAVKMNFRNHPFTICHVLTDGR